MLEVEKMRSEYRSAETRHASVSTSLMCLMIQVLMFVYSQKFFIHLFLHLILHCDYCWLSLSEAFHDYSG